MPRESIEEAGVPADLMAEWLRLDAAFERAIVKGSSDDGTPRFRTESVVVIPWVENISCVFVLADK
jgi:hypothetical protein